MSEPAHQHGGSPGYATVLERMNRFQEPEARQAIADLHLPAGSRGLDAGCGVGLYAQWLSTAIGPYGQVIGIDSGEERIAAAQHLLQGDITSGRVQVRQGDITALDLADQSLDWVWCCNVLHHIANPVLALQELQRVLRPGGWVIIKESQVANALFLPGHPELERLLQRAEIQCSRAEAGAQSFQERRQRTPESMRQAGLTDITMRTYVVQRQAPLSADARAYIEHTVFARNWGSRLRGLLDGQDWQQRSALCEPDSPQFILHSPDYYCMYPFHVFRAQLPA